jgi:hypothetical protein
VWRRWAGSTGQAVDERSNVLWQLGFSPPKGLTPLAVVHGQFITEPVRYA